jgi:predicted metal-dependent phosphoesterase TrpH
MPYLADLHIHTRHSFDSLSSPERIIRAAEARGLSAIAITDHNSIAGALETKKLAESLGSKVQVIIGEEVSTDKGDLLVYFLRERIAPGKLSRVLDDAESQGAACSAAHPFDFARHGIGLAALENGLLARIGAVEAFNARVPLAAHNQKALEFSNKAKKAVLAGSDAHHESEIGAAFAEFEGITALDAKSLLSAKRSLRGRISSPLVKFYSRYAALNRKLFGPASFLK